MRMLLLLLVCISAFAKTPILPEKIVQSFVDGVAEGNAPQYIYQGVNALIRFTVTSLKEQGFESEAQQIDYQWKYEMGDEFVSYLNSSRAIPDHSPFFQWLDDVMNQVIEKLGRPFCVASHICDLYSFNKTIKVGVNVFTGKCNFDMNNVTIPRKDEFRACMNTDGVFTGLFPVTVYWVIQGSCLAAGGIWVCGPLASVGQMICQNHLCGPLADRIYSSKCGG